MLAMSNHTLVLGGTGKTGRRIVERLEREGVSVRVGSRALPFDWNDDTTWAGALDGVSVVYVSYYPDLAIAGAPERTSAPSRGSRRPRASSGSCSSPAAASPRRSAPSRKSSRRAPSGPSCAAAGSRRTSARRSCSTASSRASSPCPAGDVPEPFVDVEDIADVATAALTEDGHHGQIYELTGPRALRFDEVAAEIAAATGRPVRFVPVPGDAFHAGMLEAGVPVAEAALVSFLFREVLDGRNAQPQDGVRRALGRAPRDFGEYARITAASGAWS